jgi:metallo-beta-lactamase class B
MLSLLPILLHIAQPGAADPSLCWQEDWCAPAEPFRIAGNVHYVGTKGLSAFLITDPKGHVLIDGGLPQSAPLIAANIRKLGFRVEDVRYLLINHAHFDHAGGLAELKRLSGAKLVASNADAGDLEAGRARHRPEQPGVAPVKVDRRVGDGDEVRVGGIRLTAMLTPGHTPGATSWLMTVEDGGKPLRVLFASSLSVAGLKLPSHPGYPNAAADFRSTFARLRATQADIFLSFHPNQFGMDDKLARQGKGVNPFIDRPELGRRVAAAEAAFEAELTTSTK